MLTGYCRSFLLFLSTTACCTVCVLLLSGKATIPLANLINELDVAEQRKWFKVCGLSCGSMGQQHASVNIPLKSDVRLSSGHRRSTARRTWESWTSRRWPRSPVRPWSASERWPTGASGSATPGGCAKVLWPFFPRHSSTSRYGTMGRVDVESFRRPLSLERRMRVLQGVWCFRWAWAGTRASSRRWPPASTAAAVSSPSTPKLPTEPSSKVRTVRGP